METKNTTYFVNKTPHHFVPTMSFFKRPSSLFQICATLVARIYTMQVNSDPSKLVKVISLIKIFDSTVVAWKSGWHFSGSKCVWANGNNKNRVKTPESANIAGEKPLAVKDEPFVFGKTGLCLGRFVYFREGNWPSACNTSNLSRCLKKCLFRYLLTTHKVPSHFR